MNICHLVFAPDSLTYLASRAAVSGGHTVHICLTDPDQGRKLPHKIMQRIVRIPGVVILSGEDASALPPSFDRLIVQVFPRPATTLDSPLLKRVAARSRRITLVTAGDRSRSRRAAWQVQWHEMRRLSRWLGRLDQVTYKDGPHPLDLFAWKRRHVAGFDIHSLFMDDETAFAHIQDLDWQPESPRPILANFMGSQDPAIRKRALDSIRPANPMPAEALAGADGAPKDILWHEYSDAEPAALGLKEFVDALTASDFTLCPPGYSLITHRPIEAMLRGSIPVLHANELDLYDIDLVDGVNCIAVPPGQWPAALERCRNMAPEAIVSMRRAIRALVEASLSYARSAPRIRRNFGIAP